MKIVSCFRDVSEIEPLAEAGASEFYCGLDGVPDFAWAGLPDLRTLAAAVRKAHSLGRRIALAVNSIVLRDSGKWSCRRLAARLAEIDRMGIDAFIVANPSLFPMLEGRRLKAGFHLSSVQPCFNSMAVDYFRRFGVTRVILPSQLRADEAGGILALCRRHGIETEVFDPRFFGCVYVNGRCKLHPPLLHTRRSEPGCGLFCGAGAWERLSARPLGSRAAPLLDRLKKRLRGRKADGMAQLFDFYAAGVGYLKYGTRMDSLRTKVMKVSRMRETLRLLSEGR
ncbi:MAG: U32 family peptidase [Elusimicrobiota bacterium]